MQVVAEEKLDVDDRRIGKVARSAYNRANDVAARVCVCVCVRVRVRVRVHVCERERDREIEREREAESEIEREREGGGRERNREGRKNRDVTRTWQSEVCGQRI